MSCILFYVEWRQQSRGVLGNMLGLRHFFKGIYQFEITTTTLIPFL